MIEEWKDVVGYEGLYQVSNLGRVRNRRGKIMAFRTRGSVGSKKPRRSDDYLMIKLDKNGVTKNHRVHRLVATAFVDGDTSLDVNHRNGVKQDNRACNLEWVTPQQNNAHALRTGLVPSYNEIQAKLPRCKELLDAGVTRLEVRRQVGISLESLNKYFGRAEIKKLLTEEQVNHIKYLHSQGESKSQIAQKFKVSKKTVSRLIGTGSPAKRLTPEDHVLIRLRISEGAPYAHIAKEVGCSANIIARYYGKSTYKLLKKPETSHEVKKRVVREKKEFWKSEIQRQVDLGIKLSETAKSLGISESTCKKYANLPAKPRYVLNLTEDEINHAKSLVLQGYPIAFIAKELKIPWSVARKLCANELLEYERSCDEIVECAKMWQSKIGLCTEQGVQP